MSLAHDIAKHQRKLDDEARADELLEKAELEIKSAIIRGTGVVIGPQADDFVTHQHVIADHGSEELDTWLCLAHSDLIEHGRLDDSFCRELRKRLDKALDKAAKAWAPKYIEERQRRAREWNEALQEAS